MNKLFTLIVGSVLFLAACSNNNVFTVSGKLANAKDTSFFVVKLDSGKFKVIDTIAIDEQGNFEYEGVSTEESFYKISNRGYTFDFTAKNGDHLEFEADAASTYEPYTIKGNANSILLAQLNGIYVQYTEHLQDLNNEYEEAQKKGTVNIDSLVSVLNLKENTFTGKMIDSVKQFITSNKQSLVAIYAFNYLDPNQNVEFMVDFANGLAASANKNHPFAKSFLEQVATLQRVSIGQPAPELNLPDVNGNIIALSSCKGHYTILDFWASWCGPCREENPNLVKVYNQYKDKGLMIYGVSLDKAKEPWVEAIAADKLNWIHVGELKYWASEAAKSYQVNAIPSNFILDKEGKIISKNLRGADLEAFLKKLFTEQK